MCQEECRCNSHVPQSSHKPTQLPFYLPHRPLRYYVLIIGTPCTRRWQSGSTKCLPQCLRAGERGLPGRRINAGDKKSRSNGALVISSPYDGCSYGLDRARNSRRCKSRGYQRWRMDEKAVRAPVKNAARGNARASGI